MVVAVIDNTYDQFINSILNARGRFSCGDEYHERHHIVPKCMGGSDDKENLIDLFAREHFVAHRLLVLENLDNDKLTYAWWAMSHLKDKNQKRFEISAEEYEEAKRQYIKTRSQKMIGENNPMFGISPKDRMNEDTYLQWKENIIKSTSSDEFKAQARDRNIGKKYSDDINKKKGKNGQEHHLYGKHQSEETKQKLRDANTGKVQSEETRKKISAATSGKNNPFYGKTHTEESRKKISDAKTGKPSKVKGVDAPNARKIIQYDLDGNLVRIWDYMKQAADTLNISYTGIHACCKGKQKTAGGFIWRYFDENKGDKIENTCI